MNALLKILILTMLTGCAFADTGVVYNLQFTGTIINESCEVETASEEQSVNLGEFTTSEFRSAGATTPSVPFYIELKNCSQLIKGTKVWFNGISDLDNPSLLALSNTGKGQEGTLAMGLGIEILDVDQKTIAINNTDSLIYPLVPGTNKLTFNLRYKSTKQAVTHGDATAVMYFDLLYQ